MKKRYIAGIIVVIAIIALFLVSSLKNQVEYVTAPVTKRTIQHVVEASGTINPVNTVSVGSTVSGLISAIYVDFNSKVKKRRIAC